MYYTPKELRDQIERRGEVRTETGRFLKDTADWIIKQITRDTVNPPYEVKPTDETE